MVVGQDSVEAGGNGDGAGFGTVGTVSVAVGGLQYNDRALVQKPHRSLPRIGKLDRNSYTSTRVLHWMPSPPTIPFINPFRNPDTVN